MGKGASAALNAFHLQYPQDEKRTKGHLVECGRKFVSMLGAHHRHCRGTAFCMKDGEPFKVFVDSRVMLDAAFFMKTNPNYTRPRPDALGNKKTDDDILSEPSNERSPDQVKDNGVETAKFEEKEFLICCPTVPGFSLGDKMWSMVVSLLRYSCSYINPMIHSGIRCCRYKRHRMVLITF